jgi:microcystin degradation protein MlrC
MNNPPRIALGSILTECNEFGGTPIDIDWFKRYELRRGNAILEVDTGVVGGMLQVMRECETTVLPLIYASTCPGGPLTSECYSQLKTELLDRLHDVTPVDGVLLPLHGAAVVENLGDLEGDIIKAVREIVGVEVPIVVTLDLHAHVTADMVRYADALIAWETYPHRDAFNTGVRGAQLLWDILTDQCRPTMAMAKVPVLTSAIHGSTEGDDPFAQIMRAAKFQEGYNGVLLTSVFLVYPYLDSAEMGSGAVVITDNDIDKAVEVASELAIDYWERRFDLEPTVDTPQDAIANGLQTDGCPVLLVEAADCIGGGAAGDSVATLKALLDAKVDMPSLVPVVDPATAAACHRANIGKEVTVEIGHQLDPRWGRPITVTGSVTTLSDGKFRYVGGIWDGVEGEMGPSAVLTIGAIQVLVATYSTYDWMDEQFRSIGLDPSTAKFIVVKNPMNYRLAYGEIAKAAFILDTPGATPVTCRHLPYKYLKRPYFPLDTEIPGLTPTILQ